jgi:GNAT superfamily N-acetyltransferase
LDAWHRAIAFIRTVDARSADQIVPSAWGRAFINRRLALVHDLNYLVAERLDDSIDAARLAREADRIQGPLGLSHRRVNVDDPNAVPRLAPGFQELGFSWERFVLMAHRGPRPLPQEGGPVQEIDWAALRPAREQEIRSQPWARDPVLVTQILAKHELTASRIATRYFGRVVDGRVVSSCELRTEGDVAQIETVETLEDHRGRGYARAVVTAALQAASGHDLIFLVADTHDWPQHFYARLGFEPIGFESRFLRLLDPEPSELRPIAQ